MISSCESGSGVAGTGLIMPGLGTSFGRTGAAPACLFLARSACFNFLRRRISLATPGCFSCLGPSRKTKPHWQRTLWPTMFDLIPVCALSHLGQENESDDDIN